MRIYRMSEIEKTQWHPAFYEGLQIDLYKHKDRLVFEAEHKLTTEPLSIDILIIKKPPDVNIDSDIARIFRAINIVEFKSPDDSFSVRDFYKIRAYANLYLATASSDSKIDATINQTDITLTIAAVRYPKGLIEHLINQLGYSISPVTDGVYYVSGDLFPIQILELKKLSSEEYTCLKSLSGSLNFKELEHA
jgi:hypothetical protein